MIKSIIYFTISLFYHINSLPYMTPEECNHSGMPHKPASIVLEFQSSTFSKSEDVAKNDLLLHHKISKEFCEHRKKKLKKSPCTWQQYYQVLDHLRGPFKNLYDPGMGKPIHLSTIQAEGKSGSEYQSSCDVMHNPTAKKLYKYVVGNKPVIIKGVAKKWPAVKKWNDRYLYDTLSGKNVVVSVTPTGDFDGPEPKELWDPSLTEPYIIARPAHWSTTFEVFMDMLEYSKRHHGSDKKKSETETSTGVTHMKSHNVSRPEDAYFYLEYFPLAVLGDQFYDDVPPMEWANFLIKRTNLLWMGGGTQKTVGRLHFDRNENLMAMIRGTKTFVLYDPGQSKNLYGDTPLRSATLNFTFGKNSEVIFRREAGGVAKKSVDIHAYSPVDITNPDYKNHPSMRDVKGFNCTIHTGDILYVPSHWWHQVISYDEDGGKSIGVNYFFEPFYDRPAYKCVPPYMIYNRHYSHIRELKTVSLCSKENICFTSTTTKKKKKSKSKKKTIKKKKSKKKRKSESENVKRKKTQNKKIKKNKKKIYNNEL